MIANYFKVALRVMLRTRSFSAINIIGLALGMTGALLLFLWIAHEHSYEQFHENKDRLFNAWNKAKENGQVNTWNWTPRILASTLKHDYSNVEQAVSVAQWGEQHLFNVGDVRITKRSGIFTDAPFLTMFSFPLVKGDVSKALSEPNSIVITEEFARQLFGNGEAYNEIVSVSQSGHTFEFKVTGVLKSLPANTDFNFEYILPFSFLESLGEKDVYWGNNSVFTWVLLTPGTTLEETNAQIKDVVRKHYAEGKHIDVFLHPLTKMRLYSRFENGVEAGGRIEIINMLGVLGIVLLVIAAINFVNLSTARAQRRAKEVAVRKVTGAIRTSLVVQFLCESVLITAVAGVLSVIAAFLLLSSFNNLIGKTLTLPLSSVSFWLTVGGFVVIIGLLAGSYPALYLSSFRPAKIMKGVRTGSTKSLLRTTLVVVQFGFAVTLIVSAFVIREQIAFVQNRDAGYSREQLIHLPLSGDMKKNFQAFHNEVLQNGIATSVTKTSAPITEQWSSSGGMKWRGKNPEDRTDFERIYMDNQPAVTFGLTLVRGRDIDIEKFPSDSSAMLINETAARVMGFDDPINEVITDNQDFHIVGVVKDFVFTSPYQKVEPIMMFGPQAKWAFNVVYLKLNANKSTKEHLDKLAELTAKYNPAYPFEYHFADQEYARKFDNLQRTLLITTVFTGSAILIACLGLLGLSVYMTEARVKEIGIRKVLGGSVLHITRLLSLGALKPILIAVVLFIPLGWFSIDWWLQSFAYRVSVSAWTFVLSAFAIIAIALLTIATQTVRAAQANPVDSLKNE
jgi:putative ABC transport system permease protein